MFLTCSHLFPGTLAPSEYGELATMVGVATMIIDGGGCHDTEGQELPMWALRQNGNAAAPIPTWRTLVLLTAMVLNLAFSLRKTH